MKISMSCYIKLGQIVHVGVERKKRESEKLLQILELQVSLRHSSDNP